MELPLLLFEIHAGEKTVALGIPTINVADWLKLKVFHVSSGTLLNLPTSCSAVRTMGPQTSNEYRLPCFTVE